MRLKLRKFFTPPVVADVLFALGVVIGITYKARSDDDDSDG
jgi:hypothetical protein